MRFLLIPAVALLAACVHAPDTDVAAHGHDHDHRISEGPADGGWHLPPGSNQMLRAPIQAAPGLEVIVSDVIIPPNARVPWHYHPGEEYVYVIEGSALHREAGQADKVLKAGDTYAIRPNARHSPVGGPKGARAIVFRVHVKGQPERIADAP